jgi:DNA-directed RNA polymerase specialized sigma24 family protein
MAMDADDNITQWVGALRSGDKDAARKLWQGYFDKLVRLVEKKLPAHTRRAFDGEDVALSAFNSFCQGVAAERFPDLTDRGNLWAILVVIGTRKAQAYFEGHNRQKRGSGNVRGDSVFVTKDEQSRAGFDGVAGGAPMPEFIAQAEEECERLLELLGNDVLKSIAILKMQGFTIDEIATQTGCTKRAVQRKLDIIRTVWRDESMQKEAGAS